MNPLAFNSGDYNIEAENACASLLSRFNSDYIFDVCNYALTTRNIYSIIEKPNIVNSCELSFNALKMDYPSDVENIMEVRDKTYLEIIDRLCKFNDLQFYDQSEEIHMPLAQALYHVFASGYIRCLTRFFSTYIMKNRYELYDSLKLGEMKKNKDSSTFYNKKVYKKDLRLGLIIANIDIVVSAICVNDITFDQILLSIFTDHTIVDMILNSVRPLTEVFEMYKITLADPNIRAAIITDVQLQLSDLYMKEMY